MRSSSERVTGEGSVQEIENALDRATKLISQGSMAGVPDFLVAVRRIEPGFKLPTHLQRIFESSQQIPLALNSFAEVEELINENVLIPKGFVYCHFKFGVGVDKPQVFSGTVRNVRDYCELPTGEMTKLVEVTRDSRSIAMAGVSRGITGFIDPQALSDFIDQQYEEYRRGQHGMKRGEALILWQLMASNVKHGNISREEVKEAIFSRGMFEEGEHAVSSGLERRSRAVEGSADFLRLFIQPQHHQSFRDLYARLAPFIDFSEYVSNLNVSRDNRQESEPMVVNRAAIEVWAGLRSVIKAMQVLIDQGKHKSACFVFWEYATLHYHHTAMFSLLTDSQALRSARVRGKINFDPILDTMHELGSKIVITLLERFGFSPEEFQETDRRRGKKKATFSQKAAEEQLALLQRVAQELLIEPAGLRYKE